MRPVLMPQQRAKLNLVHCTTHGFSQYCHVNEDGTHVSLEWCTCSRDPRACPIVPHRIDFLLSENPVSGRAATTAQTVLFSEGDA